MTPEEQHIKQAVKDALADKAIVDLEHDTVKRAVKEAMTDKAIADLGIQIQNLSQQVSKGFTEVTQRQDITNGKVLAAGIDIIKIKSRGIYEKVLWTIITLLIGVTTYFLTRN